MSLIDLPGRKSRIDIVRALARLESLTHD